LTEDLGRIGARGSRRLSYPFPLSFIARTGVRRAPPETHPKAPRSFKHSPEKPRARK
jgi:hypothetical protein